MSVPAGIAWEKTVGDCGAGVDVASVLGRGRVDGAPRRQVTAVEGRAEHAPWEQVRGIGTLLGEQLGAAGGVQGQGGCAARCGHETGRLRGRGGPPPRCLSLPWSDSHLPLSTGGLQLPRLPVRGVPFPWALAPCCADLTWEDMSTADHTGLVWDRVSAQKGKQVPEDP